MNASQPAPHARPSLLRAMMRGFRGRCPRCGKGALLSGYISPIATCAHCGEALAPYQTADFAAYLVVFSVGLVFTPATAALSTSHYASGALIACLVLAALASALILLPRAKGAAIALLWFHGITVNQ